MPEPESAESNNTEPTFTAAGFAAAIGGLIILVLTRLNRSIDILNVTEMGDLKSLLALATPLAAAIWIRGRVTPNKRVEEKVRFGVAAGYAQGLEDDPSPPAEVDVPAPAPVRKARAAKQAAKKKPAKP